MIDKSRDNQGQVISNTAAILTALQHHPAGLSMDELIRRTELPRS
ncbi:helix-turn-helix domain-containing protein, partial [Methylophaga sp. UBA5088]